VTGRTRITRVEDKGEGKGALITMEKRVSDTATGLLLATTRTTIFARGNGGFGGERGASPPAPPPLAPTRQVEIATSPRMALLYRLTGDRNPLHADPEAAKLAGYDRPIGHGLSLLGAVAHALLAHGGAVTGVLRMLRTRFTSPFFPGETLCLLIEDASPRLRFELHSVERRVALLSRGEAHIE
jgi:acyl dehydratase